MSDKVDEIIKELDELEKRLSKSITTPKILLLQIRKD